MKKEKGKNEKEDQQQQQSSRKTVRREGDIKGEQQ